MRRVIFLVLLVLSASNAPAGFPEGKSALAHGDFPAAFREFLAAANEGDVRAQLAAGLLYASGRGTDRNYSEAVKWFRRAAEQNNPHGQLNLGVMYHTGRGVTRSAAEAAGWYRKAADLGLLQAQADLGAMYLAESGVKYDYPEALKWLHLAAERGHAIAQANLACAYLMGGATRYSGEGIGLMGPRTGVTGTLYPKNEAEAAKWLRKAAAQGHVFSQFNLGFLFEKGLGVARDHSEAIAWYRRAVDAGLAQALMNLAVLYESGVDVARDPAAAMQLRMKSSRVKIHRPQAYPILMVQWGAGIELGEVNVDAGSQPAKDDLLMLFSPAFSIDPELDSSSSSTSASSQTQSGDTSNANDVAKTQARAPVLENSTTVETTGGMFQIIRMGAEAAELKYIYRNMETGRDETKIIEVKMDTDGGIRIAVVRKIISVIRNVEQGDFLWDSRRLNRNLLLSARARDNAGLEDFMMREFFSDPHQGKAP